MFEVGLMTVKISVLLADDHKVLREATAELIDHQPDMMVIGQVGTGEEAIEHVRDLQPNVVVMDIAMPRDNGLEATRQIVADFPETKVLVLSAHQDAEHVIPLLEAGAIGYLPKTVSLDELLAAIRATSMGESVLPTPIASLVVKHLSGELPQVKDDILTERELEILCLVARGFTNSQVAHQLHLSTRTIEAHLTHIFNKLNVNSRTEAALLAQRKGWIFAE
jgi:DNA-binding NarL/FixJ family response regulator